MLATLGIDFRSVVPEVEELRGGASADVLVLENARRKALAGFAEAPGGGVALGVDTEVVLDDRTLGKAKTESAARARLEALSGRSHKMLSGVVLLGPAEEAGHGSSPRAAAPAERRGLARSRVEFKQLEGATIDRYLASGEWRDRAGAYAIQGLGSTLVASLHGDFANVVGLPLELLFELAPELFPTLEGNAGKP